MKSETLLVDPVLTAAYVLKLEARIRRLRALVLEMNHELGELEGEHIVSVSALEATYYPTIERGDMTEE